MGQLRNLCGTGDNQQGAGHRWTTERTGSEGLGERAEVGVDHDGAGARSPLFTFTLGMAGFR